MSIACPGGTPYAVRPGDTLFALASRFSTTVAAIQAANPGLDPLNLQVGQILCLPRAPGPAPCPGGTAYLIQPGDTFYLIAQQFGLSLQALRAANPGVDPNRLQIGQVICVPQPPAPGPAPLCCTVLQLVGQIPLSQLFPGGVVLLKPAATATEAVSVTFAAAGLPAPSVFGDFDAYEGRIFIPLLAPGAPPDIYGVILMPVRNDDQITWAGTRVIPTQIPNDATLEVRVINSAVGRGGEQILRNTTGVC